MASTTDRDYTAVVVKVGRGFVMGYCPKDAYIYMGDEVELENSNRGQVLMKDDYLSYERLQEIEKDTCEELVKIKAVYHRDEIKWED